MVKGLSPLPRPGLQQVLESQASQRRGQGSAPTETSPAAGTGSAKLTPATTAQAAANQGWPDSRQLRKGASLPVGAQGKGAHAPGGGASTSQGQPSHPYDSAQQLATDQHRREHQHGHDQQEGQPSPLESTPQ